MGGPEHLHGHAGLPARAALRKFRWVSGDMPQPWGMVQTWAMSSSSARSSARTDAGIPATTPDCHQSADQERQTRHGAGLVMGWRRVTLLPVGLAADDGLNDGDYRQAHERHADGGMCAKVDTQDTATQRQDRHSAAYPMPTAGITDGRFENGGLLVYAMLLLAFYHRHDALGPVGDDGVELCQRTRRWQRPGPLLGHEPLLAVYTVRLLGHPVMRRLGFCGMSW